MIYLSSADVRKLVSMEELIPAMSEAFIDLSAGRVLVPQRMHLEIPGKNGVELLKPAYSPQLNRTAVKVISLFQKNPEKGLPFSHALIMLLDGETGIPLAVMEGDYLTALRTGAASGLATRLLARKNASVLAVFGAGFQSRAQVAAILSVRKITKMYIIDKNKSKAQQFSEKIASEFNMECSVPESMEVLQEVDIICTATTADHPVFSDAFISPGTHINAIGSFQPAVREVPSATIHRARVFADQKAAVIKESGDIRIPINEGVISEDHIIAELGEISAGEKAGRISDEDITLFKSVGNAIQDLYAANLVYEKAIDAGLGQKLAF